MTKKKRYSFDFPVDSIESQWMENQANRKAALSILIRKVVKQYGTKDIVDVALEKMDLFSNNSEPQPNKLERGENKKPESTYGEDMVDTYKMQSADSAQPERSERQEEKYQDENRTPDSAGNNDIDQVKTPKGFNRLSR